MEDTEYPAQDQINAILEILRDPEKRAQYDALDLMGLLAKLKKHAEAYEKQLLPSANYAFESRRAVDPDAKSWELNTWGSAKPYSPRPTYDWPAEVTNMKSDLKDMEKKAISSGLAVEKPSTSTRTFAIVSGSLK